MDNVTAAKKRHFRIGLGNKRLLVAIQVLEAEQADAPSGLSWQGLRSWTELQQPIATKISASKADREAGHPLA